MHIIKQLRNEKKLTIDDLASKTGISKRQISAYESEENDIPLKKLRLIATALEVSISELLNENLGSDNVSELNTDYFTKKIDSLSRMVPVFDQYAFATEVSEWDTQEWLNERQFISTTLPEDGHYYWFPISGDSMCKPDSNKCINDGDFVLGRELYRHYWLDSLHIHRVNLWVIITPNGVMLKEIIKHNKKLGIITCHSWNNLYADFDIHLDNVTKLFYFKELRKVKF